MRLTEATGRLAQPWAVPQELLAGLLAEITDPHSVAVGSHGRKVSTPGRKKTVALMRLHGVLEKDSFWNLDTGRVTQVFQDFARDENVGAIVLHMNSPGGSVFGIEELSDEILQARKSKPVVAVADGLMASAAYWLGASASKVVATPSSQVGSIGVYLMHFDTSKFMEEIGIRPTFVSAGKYKTEGNEFEPMSDSAREHAQSIVDGYYKKFVGAVAKGRGVGVAEVRKNYGEGRMLLAEDALKAGMIDEIGSLESVLTGLSSSVGVVPAAAADLRRRKFSLEKQKNGLTASRT